MNCKNCQKILQNDAKYCLKCGQSAASLNKPFLDVAKEMTHELLDIDGKLWLTLRTMFTKPGKLTHEFNLGKRVKYTPPLRLYLVISILFFIVFSKVYQVFDPDVLFTESMLSYYSKAMFVLFPVFALIVQVFFRQTFYIGNLVFSMHLHSMAYFILMIIAPLEAMEQSHITFLLLQIPPVLYMTWYVLRAFKVVFQQAWWQIIIKSFAIYMIYMALLGIVFDVVMKHIY